jgi:hypothetical protein
MWAQTGKGTNPEVIEDMADPDTWVQAGNFFQMRESERICLVSQGVKNYPAQTVARDLLWGDPAGVLF